MNFLCYYIQPSMFLIPSEMLVLQFITCTAFCMQTGAACLCLAGCEWSRNFWNFFNAKSLITELNELNFSCHFQLVMVAWKSIRSPARDENSNMIRALEDSPITKINIMRVSGIMILISGLGIFGSVLYYGVLLQREFQWEGNLDTTMIINNDQIRYEYGLGENFNKRWRQF